MILICPSCGKRYLVPSGALGSAGRRVRCAACGESWFQEPPPQEPEPEAAVTSFDEPVITPPPEDIEPPPLRPGYNVPAIRRPKEKKKGIFGCVMLGVFVLALLTGGVFARSFVVDAWPPAARLYELVGLPIPVPGAGLVLHDVATERQVKGGVPILVVTGTIANPTQEVREVPKLRVSLRDAHRREIQAWVFAADTGKLVPGEFVKFGGEFANPSTEAVDLTLTFTN